MSNIPTTNREDMDQQTSTHLPITNRMDTIRRAPQQISATMSAPDQALTTIFSSSPSPVDKRPRAGSSSDTITQQDAKRSRILSSGHSSLSDEVIEPLMSLNLSGNNGNGTPATTSTNLATTSTSLNREERDPDVGQRVHSTHAIEPTAAPESANNESDDLEREDPYEKELPPHLLPYYKKARRTTLATARMSERLKFYTWCKEQDVTPLDLTFRPLALQGIELSPEHIQAWKGSISGAENRHTVLTCDILQAHLNLKTQEMDNAIAGMTAGFQSEPDADTIVNTTLEILARKGAKCRAQVHIKSEARKERTTETARLFSLSTNVSRLPRTAYLPSTAPPKRKRSESRSRSRTRGNTQVRRQREQTNTPASNQTHNPPRPTPPQATPNLPPSRGVSFAPQIDRDAITRIVDQAIQDYMSSNEPSIRQPDTRSTLRPPSGRGRDNRQRRGRGRQISYYNQY